MNFFNVESVKTYIMDLSKREKPPWTKFCQKTWPTKLKKKGEYLSDESWRKELENKAYPSEFMAATTFFLDRARLTGCLVLWRSPQLFFSFAD